MKHTTFSANLAESVLFIPCMTEGNIPQLTVDLMIATLGMQHVASFFHDAVVPFITPSTESDGRGYNTAMTLHHSAEAQVACFQISSFVSLFDRARFADDLARWCLEGGIRRVVLIHSTNRRDWDTSTEIGVLAGEDVESVLRNSPIAQVVYAALKATTDVCVTNTVASEYPMSDAMRTFTALQMKFVTEEQQREAVTPTTWRASHNTTHGSADDLKILV